MSSIKKIAVILFSLCMVGCATAYKRTGFTGGYNDMKIQDDVFKVSFRGNAYTGSGKVEDFVLLRSAEVALNNGYKYFVIIDEKSAMKTSAYTTPVTANTNGVLNSFGNMASYNSQTTYSGGQTYIFHKPSSTNTIKCFREKPENIPTIVYDAAQIQDNLKRAYGIN